mmetsp:Transcript_10545/g.25589  ORF Transcript_10545/g.25589 Transcript_10545/m.25589 type:complete len:85 (+) Transcript_10545:155-409(+)
MDKKEGQAELEADARRLAGLAAGASSQCIRLPSKCVQMFPAAYGMDLPLAAGDPSPWAYRDHLLVAVFMFVVTLCVNVSSHEAR